jgi:hypothetical protein
MQSSSNRIATKTNRNWKNSRSFGIWVSSLANSRGNKMPFFADYDMMDLNKIIKKYMIVLGIHWTSQRRGRRNIKRARQD